jgi:hypothetical protein
MQCHDICSDCVGEHCSTRLAQPHKYACGATHCPHAGCSQILRRDQLKKVLAMEELALHDRQIQQFAQIIQKERSPIGNWIGRFAGRAAISA